MYLIPVPISEHQSLTMIPDQNNEICRQLKHFIAEDAKIARKHLKIFGYANLSEAMIEELNEHNRYTDLRYLLEPLLAGNDVGLMSDAGCPGIADPGAEIVAMAHNAGIEVIPLTGPSSIVLAIMSSGFTGQNFAFNGYLPVEKNERQKQIKQFELHSAKWHQAQFFIETPYRNEQLFQALLTTLQNTTRLYVGISIASPSQQLQTRTVEQWKKLGLPAFHKLPTVFGLFAGN